MSAAHHDDGHEAFDPEPVTEIGADETPSPGWLPIAGAALFTVGVGWLFFPGADAIAKAPEAPAVVAPVRAAAPARKPAAQRSAAQKPAGDAKDPSRKPSKGLAKGALKKLGQPKKP